MKKLVWVGVSVILLAAMALPAWAEPMPPGIEAGLAAVEKGDMPAAFKALLPGGEEGNPAERLLLGLLNYPAGVGPEGAGQAAKWFRMIWAEKFDAVLKELRPAAEGGDAQAQYVLGMANAQGILWDREKEKGLNPPDTLARSVSWYGKSAEGGNSMARYALGFLYCTDHSARKLPVDTGRGLTWLEKAAAQGNVMAASQLAYIYRSGKGVKKDRKKAAGWYLRAAEMGSVRAQETIGLYYMVGMGVDPDPVQCYKWASLAAAGGSKEAADLLETVAGELTPSQLAEAKKLAREFRPKKPK